MLDILQSKTVVVTGAAGFLGSHLVDALLANGAVVYGIDNLLTGRKSNLEHLSQPELAENFHFIEADVSKPVEDYFPADIKPHFVLHFASPASPPLYQKVPMETYMVNSFGTHFWLSYLQRTNPEARFLFASTSEIYGDPQVHPQPESYWGNVNPNGPRSCYDESKRLGETICGVFQRHYDLDVRMVRIFNTYGPRINPADKRVIPDFVMKALKGEPLQIFGDGSQTRSYCYVDDLIRGILLLLTMDDLAGETVNIGNPEEFTVLETAKVITRLVRELYQISVPEPVFKPLPTDDPLRRKPDITKAQQLLSWQPETSFEAGVRQTIEYMKQHEMQ